MVNFFLPAVVRIIEGSDGRLSDIRLYCITEKASLLLYIHYHPWTRI